MTKCLLPYGCADRARNATKVGKGKTPKSLAARMPSPELAAKVGTVTSTLGISLSPAAPFEAFGGSRRVVRRKAAV